MEEYKVTGKDFLILLLLAPLLYLWDGFVFIKLWSWFLVGLTGKSITMSVAIGILIIKNFIVPTTKKYKNTTELWKDVVQSIVFTGFILLAGFIVTLFM